MKTLLTLLAIVLVCGPVMAETVDIKSLDGDKVEVTENPLLVVTKTATFLISPCGRVQKLEWTEINRNEEGTTQDTIYYNENGLRGVINIDAPHWFTTNTN